MKRSSFLSTITLLHPPSSRNPYVRVFHCSKLGGSARQGRATIKFILSLGHISLITFTLRQWHFHFNDPRHPTHPCFGTVFTANTVGPTPLANISFRRNPFLSFKTELLSLLYQLSIVIYRKFSICSQFVSRWYKKKANMTV